MSKISALLELRSMLLDMERDVGLDQLSSSEVNVLLAAYAVTDKLGEAVSSDQIRQHELSCDLAQATYHRALRSLLSMGLIQKADGYKSGRYVVNAELP